ncbi:hypothetical protein Spico_1024 [Parasphaerochaeta coccoides DSM 17374]|uniref:Uncharacterized protein n=1 Tax=Parasphaerochaeta coccoides (strain ATCC BAA-1237 / DSM 17374 / SPN1) TaxID=760011 RepID=F4GJI1_PARC1|nr:hypothetical protein Spico_1024 [Parasphaerochaeta coccoides DSM 17374]
MRENEPGIAILMIVLVALFAFVICDDNKLNISNEIRFFFEIRKALANSIWKVNDTMSIYMLAQVLRNLHLFLIIQIDSIPCPHTDPKDISPVNCRGCCL